MVYCLVCITLTHAKKILEYSIMTSQTKMADKNKMADNFKMAANKCLKMADKVKLLKPRSLYME